MERKRCFLQACSCQFLGRPKIAFVEFLVHFAIGVPVPVSVLFALASSGEMSLLPFEMKRAERTQPGEPLRRIRGKRVMPSIRIIEKVRISTGIFDNGI